MHAMHSGCMMHMALFSFFPLWCHLFVPFLTSSISSLIQITGTCCGSSWASDWPRCHCFNFMLFRYYSARSLCSSVVSKAICVLLQKERRFPCFATILLIFFLCTIFSFFLHDYQLWWCVFILRSSFVFFVVFSLWQQGVARWTPTCKRKSWSILGYTYTSFKRFS